MPVTDPKALIENRVEAIRKYHADAGIERAELDVSGGVDSAVMLGLLAQALGPDKITAVYQGINSSPESLERAREVAAVFRVALIEIDLTDIFDRLTDAMKASIIEASLTEGVWDRIRPDGGDPTVLGSIRSCLRAPIGRGFNRMMGGGIRHGTGNECEDRWTRFYQKGGDGEVDCNAIAMLSKGEVYQLALALGVPRSIITARPTPDLWGTGDAHSDEDEYAAHFGFAAGDFGQTFYGYIDVETGEYTKVGLIERVSRYLETTPGSWLFSDESKQIGDVIGACLNTAHTSPPFNGVDSSIIPKLLAAARRIERRTRHKHNPACPSLGDRGNLVKAGIITNTLPATGEAADGKVKNS